MSVVRRRARDLMPIVRRRAWAVTKVFVGLAAGLVAAVFLWPAIYQSDAVVQLASPDDARLAASRLKDRATLETLAREFRFTADLLTEPEGMARAADAMAPRVGVGRVADDILRVSFQASDARIARQGADRLAQIALGVPMRPPTAAPPPATGGLLEKELAEADTLLVAQQERLDAYHARHPREDAARLDEAGQALQSAQAESQALAVAIERDRARLQSRPRPAAPAATPAPGSLPPPPDPLLPELTAARANLIELLNRLTPAHPDVIRQEDEIRELEATLASRAAVPPPLVMPVPRPPAPSSPSETDAETIALTQSIAAREAQRRRVLQTIATLRATLDTAPEEQAELFALTRDYEALQRLRANLVARADPNAVDAQAAPVRGGHILVDARAADRPVSPNRRRALAVGLAAAFLLALGTGAYQETRDTRVHDEDDLRAVANIAVLGVVGEVMTREEAAARRVPVVLRALVAPALAAGLVLAWWWAR